MADIKFLFYSQFGFVVFLILFSAYPEDHQPQPESYVFIAEMCGNNSSETIICATFSTTI